MIILIWKINLKDVDYLKFFMQVNPNTPFRSIPRDSKEIANQVEFVKFVFFVEVTIALCFPEATRTHVEACLSFLQSNKSGHEFVIR